MKTPEAATRPLKIQRFQETQTLRIEWADEHSCEMPYDYLRRACPCAICTTDRTETDKGLRVINGESPQGPLQVNEISLVGSYAINLNWSDGHDTGIYSFRFLRELCPHNGAGP